VGDEPVTAHGTRSPGPDHGAVSALVALVSDNVLIVVAWAPAGVCGALLAFWIWLRGGPHDPEPPE